MYLFTQWKKLSRKFLPLYNDTYELDSVTLYPQKQPTLRW